MNFLMNFLIIFFLMVSFAHSANVIYDKNTNEIMFIDDAKFVNLSADDKERAAIVEVPAKFDKNELTRPVSDYKFVNGKITLNTKKIADDDAVQVAEVKKLEQEIINRKSGLDKLKALGLTDAELSALFK